MLLLKGREKVKEGKRLKLLTPNKLLTTLPVLLALIKAGSHSNILKKIDKYCVYFINTIKSLKNLTSHFNNGKQHILITIEPRTFHFDLPKYAGINLKHEI